MATWITNQSGNFSDANFFVSSDSVGDQLIGTTSLNVSNANVYSANVTLGVNTIDGILVKVASKVAANPTGTFTVGLRNTTLGTTLAATTINCTDFSAYGNGWYLFKFASPVSTVGATTYAVGVSSSITNQIALYRNATANNWNCAYRTTSTGNPGAGDYIFIVGEMTGAGTQNSFSVTNDSNTGSRYYHDLNVCNFASFNTLTGANTAISLSGNFNIFAGGIFNCGSSSAFPVASAYSSTITFGCTANNSYGLSLSAGASAYFNGSYAGIQKTKLSADCNKTNVLTTVDSTGWNVGDNICIAGTTATNQYENFTINAISANSITANSNLTYYHAGQYVDPFDIRADLGKLNKNIIIQSSQTAVYNWYFLQSLSGYSEFNGVEAICGTYTVNLSGKSTNQSSIIQNCSFHNNISAPNIFYFASNVNGDFTFQSNNVYNISMSNTNGNAVFGYSIGTGTALIDNNFFNGLNFQAFLGGYYSNIGITNITNNIFTGSTNGWGCRFSPFVTNSFVNNSFYANATHISEFLGNYQYNSPNLKLPYSTISACTFGYASNYGVQTADAFNSIVLDSCTGFNSITFFQAGGVDFIVKNSIITGGINLYPPAITAISTYFVGILGDYKYSMQIINSRIGVDGYGFKTGLNGSVVDITNFNSSMSGTIKTNYLSQKNYWAIQNKDGLTGGNNFTYIYGGLISQNSVSASPGNTFCTQLTPNMATNSTGNQALWRYFIPVNNATQRVVTFNMCADSTFNGQCLLSLYYLGQQITQATATLTTVYQNYSLTANASSIIDNGGIEAWIEFDGTVGNIYLQSVTWT